MAIQHRNLDARRGPFNSGSDERINQPRVVMGKHTLVCI